MTIHRPTLQPYRAACHITFWHMRLEQIHLLTNVMAHGLKLLTFHRRTLTKRYTLTFQHFAANLIERLRRCSQFSAEFQLAPFY